VVPEGHRRAGIEDLHHGPADVVGGVSGAQLTEAGVDDAGEVVAGDVGGDGLGLTVEDDAGLLLVRDAAVIVLRLAHDGEHDLRLVLLAEPDEPVGINRSVARVHALLMATEGCPSIPSGGRRRAREGVHGGIVVTETFRRF